MIFVIKLSEDKQFYFVLRADNNEIVATSEMYVSKQSCKKGIKAVKLSLLAKTVDETPIS